MIRVPLERPDRVPCRLMFVGEAPGSEEVSASPPRPLIGPSGRVFNSALKAANIPRAECAITNVFDQQAPGNDVSEWMRDDAIREQAFRRLEAEVAKCQPTVIVPLGGTALWAFTGNTSIKSFRGAVQAATRIAPGVKLLPTYHPAAVQRDWRLMAVMVPDFLKAVREAERGPKIQYPKRELWLAPTLEEVDDFLGKCHFSDLLSVDIETGWGCITCIGFGPDAHSAMCVPFVDLRTANKSYWRDPEDEVQMWGMVRDLLASPVPKLGQNFTYDAQWLYEYGLSVRNYRHDTRLLHHALYPELDKDLGTMAALYTDLGGWKDWAHHDDKKDA